MYEKFFKWYFHNAINLSCSRQVMVVPVAGPFNEYANKIRQELRSCGYMCDSDTDDSNTMNKKVRNAQLAQYNFIFGKF